MKHKIEKVAIHCKASYSKGRYLLLQLAVTEGECDGAAMLGSQAVNGASVNGLHQVLVYLILRLLVLVACIHSDPKHTWDGVVR